jgi:hypothetical protein
MKGRDAAARRGGEGGSTHRSSLTRFVGGSGWLPFWCALILASSLLTFDRKLYINGDNVEYIRLAEAARHGMLWGSPKFPPFFPWLLALPQSVFGTALMPQKILVYLVYLVAAWLLIRRARTLFPRGYGEPIGWIAATLIPVLEFGHYVMSEVPYLCLSLLALGAFDRATSGPDASGREEIDPAVSLEAGSERHRITALILCAVAAAATFYTRSVGLSLWSALAVAIVIRRDLSWRARGLFVACSILLFLPWALRSLIGPPNPYFRQLIQVNPFYPEYGTLDLSSLLSRVGENLRIYVGGEIPTNLTPGIFRWTYDPPERRYAFLPLYVAWIPLLFVGIGLVRSIRRREPLGLYVVLYLVLSILWPTLWTGIRFLVPVLPFLALFLFDGFFSLLSLRGGLERDRRRIITAVLIVWFLLAVRLQTTLAREVRRYPPDWDAYFKAATWIKGHTSPSSIIVDRKPSMLTYVTDRRAVTFPREADPEKMVEWMKSEGVGYVLVPAIPYDDIARYLIPTVQREQAHFAPVFEVEEPYTVVLRFKPDAGAAPSFPR